MIDGIQAPFYDSWVWLLFVAIGLSMVLLELVVGVDTGLELVFIGSAFILGGLVSLPFHSWILTLVITLIICLIYIGLGRRYVNRWKVVRKETTNVDAVIGKKGVVFQDIAENVDGRVRVGNEDWKGRSAETLKAGDEVVVINVSGVTLIVQKIKGGK